MLLTTSKLKKNYGGPFELGPIDISVIAGETIALLGKNGAGKSTFFQLLTGSLDASDGEIVLKGQRLVPEACELKRQMGYLPQNLSLPRWVSGLEILRYGASLYELNEREDRVASALKYWDCDWFADRPLAACSHGMQKRVGLALATIHQPDLLILDEPFSGLDIYHIRALEQVIAKRLAASQTTILCTHIAPYAAQLCQRALLFADGKMEWLEAWPDAAYERRIEQIEQHFFA